MRHSNTGTTRFSKVVTIAASIVLGLGIAAAGSTAAQAGPYDPIYMPDDNLRACINAELGQAADAEILESQLTTHWIISCPNRGITDLTGLQHDTQLMGITLDGNPVSDLGPLEGLPRLSRVSISSTQVTDLSPLLTSGKVNNISLADMQLTDLSILSGFTDLLGLDVRRNSISDLSPIAGFSYFRYLYLDDNPIESLDPLAELINMKFFNADRTGIDDISVLANMPDLEQLQAAFNEISDISALTDLKKLGAVGLSMNHISDFSPLSDHPKIFTLGASKQTVVADDATEGVPVENPLRDNAGIILPTAEYCVDANCAELVYPAEGAGVTTTWYKELQIGASTTRFSGTLTRDVLPAAIPDPDIAPTITGTPPDGVVGSDYSFPFLVAGKPDPTVALHADTLPPGLALSARGELTGVPTRAGSYTFSVRAENGIDPVAVHQVTVKVTTADVPSKPDVPPPGNSGNGGNGNLARTGADQPPAAVWLAPLLLGGALFAVARARSKRRA